MKLIQHSEIRLFKSAIPQKSSTVDIMSRIHSLGPPKRMSRYIGPILQRCKHFEKLGNVFNMKLIQNSETCVFKFAIPQKSSTVDIMSWMHSLGPPKRISTNIGPISQRYKSFENLGNVFDMKLFQNSEVRVFKSAIPQKSSTVDIMSWIHSLGPPKRITSNIGPILQRYKNFEKLGNNFDMKLIQHSEIRVFKSAIPQKSSTVDIMSRIHSLGPRKRMSRYIGPILQRCKHFEKLSNVFDMKLIQNSETCVFKLAIPQKSSTVDIMSWMHSLGPPKRISTNIGPISQRCKSFENLGNVFDMKLFQNSEIRVFKSAILQKSSSVDIMSWIYSLAPPKRISSNIGPILQRCKNFEKLGNIFDMKLIQHSEIRVFKSAIPQKSSTVDIMSRIHSLGPPKRISTNIRPISQRCKSFENLGNVFGMKLFQNSEIRVFKSAIPQKSSSVDIMSWIYSLGPPKRISSNIGPSLQRCKNFEELGNIFDMKLIQHSEIRVFKSAIPQKSSTVDIMSRIHSLGPPKRISTNIRPISQRCKSFENLGNVSDMKLFQNSEIRVFKSAIPQKASSVDIMSWMHSLGPPKRISTNIGPISQRCKSIENLGNVFDMKLFQNSEIRVFKSAIPQKSSSVDIMSWIYSLGPPKRISSNIGPSLQRCKNFEELGNIFDMKLIQHSEIRVFKSAIPQKSSTVDIMSRIHSLGPPKRISTNIRPISQRCKSFENLGNVSDMKLFQNSEIRVFKSAIPQKASSVDIMSWMHSLGPPKRISTNIGPISQRCKSIENLGNVFDMKLFQNSEIRVFKSAIPQKSSSVDIMSWIHSLGPPQENQYQYRTSFAEM